MISNTSNMAPTALTRKVFIDHFYTRNQDYNLIRIDKRIAFRSANYKLKHTDVHKISMHL